MRPWWQCLRAGAGANRRHGHEAKKEEQQQEKDEPLLDWPRADARKEARREGQLQEEVAGVQPAPGRDGARYRFRTCDPLRVREVLYH